MKLKDIKTSVQILLQRPSGNTQKEKMQAFYKGQENDYDRYRKSLLHGKEGLFKGLSDQIKPTVWCDLGCGTAENLERAAKEWDLKDIKKIDLVDLSDSLLSVAAKRVTKLNLQQAKIYNEEAKSFLSKNQNKYDLITFSYSLSMMDDWVDVLLYAKQALKEGGVLAVTDFCLDSDFNNKPKERMSNFAKEFWTWWFQNDGVHLRENKVSFLESQFSKKLLLQNYGSLPFISKARVPYFVFHGMKASV